MKSINRQQGMTLLELLVVMVLLSVITALLMQGLSQSLAIYERVQRRQYEGVPQLLVMQWLNDSVASMQAELDAPRQLRGVSFYFEGSSQQPLVAQTGEVHPVRWSINQRGAGGVTLDYRQPGRNWTLFRWPEGTQVTFSYLGEQGNTHIQWPPEQTLISLRPDGRMPVAIQLMGSSPAMKPLNWYIAQKGRTYPRNDYRDL